MSSSGSSRGSAPTPGGASPIVFVNPRDRPLTPNPQLPGEPMSNEWMKYASAAQPSVKCSCLWKEGGKACPYKADTRGVKRHIESVHLKIKTKVCEYCGSAFAQQSNLDNHRRIHQNNRPHCCHYDGCSATFADKAAKLHHMRSIHAYEGN